MSHLSWQAESKNDVREGLAKKDQGIWELLLLPSQRESFPDAGMHRPSSTPILRPLSYITRLSHMAWFIFRKLDPTSKRRKKGDGGHSYTCCPNPALKQKPLEIINPRSGRSLLSRMDRSPLLTSQAATLKIRPAASHLLPDSPATPTPSVGKTRSRF